MALPVIQNISDTVISRLKNITVANGYEFEAGTVQIVNRDMNTWQPSPRDIYVDQQPETANDDISYPSSAALVAAFDVDFNIYGFASQLDVDADERGITDTGTTENQMIAAVKKSLVNSDGAGWHTFGSNAVLSWFSSSGHFDGPGHDGALVVLSVTYRIDETDPFTAR